MIKMRRMWEKARPFWLAAFALVAWAFVYQDLVVLTGARTLANLPLTTLSSFAIHTLIAAVPTGALVRNLYLARKP